MREALSLAGIALCATRVSSVLSSGLFEVIIAGEFWHLYARLDIGFEFRDARNAEGWARRRRRHRVAFCDMVAADEVSM
jgi:hypothetical protein